MPDNHLPPVHNGDNTFAPVWIGDRPYGYADVTTASARSGAGGLMLPGTAVSVAFIRLLSIACEELDRHLNEHGRCTACASAWPCERVKLAAFTLEAA